MENYTNYIQNIDDIEVNTYYQKSPDTTSILFDILGGNIPNKKRQHINLSIVLDKSYSMNDEFLEKAKKAIKHLLCLLYLEDTVNVIAYDENADIIIDNIKNNDLTTNLNKISNIQVGNNTDIYNALMKGINLLNINHSEDDLNLLFLISDGYSTVGKLSRNIAYEIMKLCKKKQIIFTSFGLGLNFNEKLLSNLACYSNGDYYFVDDLNTFSNLLYKVYDSYKSITATNLELKISLTKDIQLGYKSYSFIRLYSYLKHQFHFNFPISYIDWSLSYTTIDNENKTIKGSIKLQNKTHTEVICYNSIYKCKEINKQIINFLYKKQIDKVIEYKKKIINEYTKLLPYDMYGFIKQSLYKEQKRLNLIIDNGITSNTIKNNLQKILPISNYIEPYDFNTTFNENQDIYYSLFI